MMEDMFKSTYILQQALDASWLRNKAISNNIANADTPGYKRVNVEFEQFLSQAIDNKALMGTVTNAKHIPVGAGSLGRINAKVTPDYSETNMRLDGNNVDVENEMAQMAKNNIMYDALVQRISGEFSKLRTAITEGRR